MSITKGNIEFHLYCKTCDADLKYDPEYDANPIGIGEPSPEGYRPVFFLDLSWHTCLCDGSEGAEPNFVIDFIQQT